MEPVSRKRDLLSAAGAILRFVFRWASLFF